MCADGCVWLTKFASNRIEVLDSIPEEDRPTGLKNVYLNIGTNFQTEKVLGVNWDSRSDRLGFKLNPDSKPTTRCQILSLTSKIYDPLQLAAPFLLKDIRILQELYKSNFSWDDAVSDDYIVEWEKWNCSCLKIWKLRDASDCQSLAWWLIVACIIFLMQTRMAMGKWPIWE